jgi:hypothetical protein
MVAMTFAQTKGSPFVGSWKLNTAQSQQGAHPLKSLLVVIVEEKPQMLSWHGHGIEEDGAPLSLSWKGREDGSMHPTRRNGKPTSDQSARKEDGTIVRHGEDGEGSWEARSKVSDDGNTLTDEITSKSKDGSETKAVDVYHRFRVTRPQK